MNTSIIKARCSVIQEFITIGVLVAVGVTYTLIQSPESRPWSKLHILQGVLSVEKAVTLEAIWVDVRERSAYNKNHVDEAISCPINGPDSGIIELIEAWLSSPRPIVVYCDDSTCTKSRWFIKQLRADLQEAEIYYLKGGWAQWQAFNT